MAVNYRGICFITLALWSHIQNTLPSMYEQARFFNALFDTFSFTVLASHTLFVKGQDFGTSIHNNLLHKLTDKVPILFPKTYLEIRLSKRNMYLGFPPIGQSAWRNFGAKILEFDRKREGIQPKEIFL
jgi:hypothetical protein